MNLNKRPTFTKVTAGKTILRIGLSAIAIVALVSAGLIYRNKPQTAVATWWNDNWSYRRAITVTNNTSEERNVYIEISLNTDTASTSMQTDCGDFRFTKQNGEILPYFIVSGCRTTNNVIHVNFDIFPSGEQAIYFYYSNPSAENGFETSDFSNLEASNYTIGTVQPVETGPGPVGYWSFDEGYGTTAHDETANGNDGTITGATWQDESMCVSGKCLYFDGSGDYVEIPNIDF